MAGLEGTINTPVGTIQKKTALYLGGAVVILGAIVVYRQKKTGGSTTTTTDAEIDPATGFPYGSPEDAAALAQQSAYVSPSGSGGGGGSSTIPTSNVGYTSNSQWVQAVVDYMTNNDLIADPTQLSAALGKYITGAYVPPDGNEDNLIHQAIAVQGYPPVNGPNGYPPSINRNAPTTSPPTSTKPGAITGLKVVGTTATTATLDWNDSANNQGYDITWIDPGGKSRINSSVASRYMASYLPKNHTTTFNVRARPNGDWAKISATTKAK